MRLTKRHIGALVASSSVLFAGLAPAADISPETVEEVLVTGSHIKRPEDSIGSQLILLDRAQITATGMLTIADVVRASPLNIHGSFGERSGNSAQSNAALNLRGLDETRTLVLLDGRRMVGSPSLGAAVININMIPMAAVEQVEILADGASAIYGSDAVAGVANMKLRRNFDGLEITTRYGDRSEDNGSEIGASIIGGVKNEHSNITFAVEFNRRDPIWDRDRPYSAAWTRDNNNNGVIDAYVDTDGYSLYGSSIWLYDPDTGYDRVQAANNCTAGNGFLGVVDADIDWGYDSDLNENTYCMYNYADITSSKAGLERTNTYLHYERELNTSLRVYANTVFSRVESMGRYAPAAAEWNNMPADYGDVPFDIAALQQEGLIGENYSLTGLYRWTNIGNRENRVTDTLFDFVAGMEGSLNERLSFDFYFQNSRYDSKDFGYYYLSYPGLDYVLERGIDPFSKEGAYAMSATTTQDNYSRMRLVKGHLQFSPDDFLGQEDAQILWGLEYSVLNYQNLYDRASEGGFVGGSAGNSARGERDIFATFAEFLLPLEQWEFAAALRYDDYDDFGDSISPSLRGSWQATEDLGFFLRWGEGFRAPALDELWGPATFSAVTASDQYACRQNGVAPQNCSRSQFDTWFATNPNLEAETSRSVSTGLNWTPWSFMTLHLTYWNTEIRNVIQQPSTQELFYAELAGFDFAQNPRLRVQRTGGRVVVYSSYVNQGELTASGLDWNLDGKLESAWGDWQAGLFLARTLTYEKSAYPGGDTQDLSGFNLKPELKAQANLRWAFQRHALTLWFEHIGKSANQDFIAFDSRGNAFLDSSRNKLGSWNSLNASYSVDASALGRFTLGTRNIANKKPIMDRAGKFDASHYDLYDNTGRVVFVEYQLRLE